MKKTQTDQQQDKGTSGILEMENKSQTNLREIENRHQESTIMAVTTKEAQIHPDGLTV